MVCCGTAPYSSYSNLQICIWQNHISLAPGRRSHDKHGVRCTNCLVHSYNSTLHSTGLHTKGAGTQHMALAMCITSAWAYCLCLHLGTAQPWVSGHPGDCSLPQLPLKWTAAVEAKGISWHWKTELADYSPNPTPKQSHGWDLKKLFELVWRQSFVYQLLAAINRELSTACTLLHRKSSPHTSWIHYSNAVTWLNDVIKVRYCRPLKALHTVWKEIHQKKKNPSR